MEKSCIFYASKYHLTLILLEYLKNKNTEKYTVNTFLENEIEDEVKILKEKYEIKTHSANRISFKKTKEIYNKEIEKSSNMIFIIEGNQNYMKEANSYITNKLHNKKIENLEIINCFNFNQNRDNLEKIIKENNKILYTTGSKTID